MYEWETHSYNRLSVEKKEEVVLFTSIDLPQNPFRRVPRHDDKTALGDRRGAV